MNIFILASLCGIFVKGVVEGSVADVQGNIKPNDQVIQVYIFKLVVKSLGNDQ